VSTGRASAADVDGFAPKFTVEKWKQTFQVAMYRKKVMHPTRKHAQPAAQLPD
jgi:hypothetical protein